MAGRRDVRLAGGSVPCLSWVGLWAGGGVIGEPTFLRRAAAPGGRRRGARGAQRPAPRRRLPERRCVVPFPDPRAHTSADAEIALRPKMLTRCGMLAADLALH